MQKWNEANKRLRQAGSARGFLFLLIVVIGCLYEGGHKIRTALTNPHPTVMSYDAYAQARPDAQWLMLTNCQLNLFQASYLHHGDKTAQPNEYYVPVHGVGTPSGKTCVLLRTSDPDIMATANEIKALKTESALLTWMSKNSARAFPKRNVQGVVSSGLDLRSSQREALEKVERENTTQDFIILQANAEPSLAAGVSFSAAGVAALFGLVVYARRKAAD